MLLSVVFVCACVFVSSAPVQSRDLPRSFYVIRKPYRNQESAAALDDRKSVVIIDDQGKIITPWYVENKLNRELDVNDIVDSPNDDCPEGQRRGFGGRCRKVFSGRRFNLI